MNKFLLSKLLVLFITSNVLSQNEVVYVRPFGVQRDFDSKKYGIIDEKGETIVPFIYDLLPNTVTEKMVAKKNGKYGIINSKNNILVDFKYDELYSYYPYFVCYINIRNGDELKYCSVIDTNLVTIISEKDNFNNIRPISSIPESHIEFKKSNIVFKAYNFKERRVSLLLNNGKTFKTFPYDDIKAMNKYLKVIIERPNELTNLEGLIDWNGKVILKPIYRYISWIEGDAVCLVPDKDLSNAQIINIKTKSIKFDKYPIIEKPENNRCMVVGKFENNIDYRGIIDSKYEEIYPMRNCTIYYSQKDQMFTITDNVTKKIEYLACN